MTTKIVPDAQIAANAKAAGFRGEDLVTAVALAFAESGGDLYGIHPNLDVTGNIVSVDFGIWQINTVWGTQPGHYYWDILTVDGNAVFAFAVYSQGDVSKSPPVRNTFYPWVAWRNRAQIADWPGFVTRARAATGIPDPNAQSIPFPPAGFPAADVFGPNSLASFEGHKVHSGYDGTFQREIGAIQRRVGTVADGYYGSKTSDAVKVFQAGASLAASGVTGAATWNAMKITTI